MQTPRRRQKVPPTNDASATGGPVLGIRSDVYERKWEMIWMTKDDVETLESRLGDKMQFQSIAAFFFGAGLPLGIEKAFDFFGGDRNPTDMAVIIVCVGLLIVGGVFAYLAHHRHGRAETFKARLFRNENRLTSKLQLVDASGSSPTAG